MFYDYKCIATGAKGITNEPELIKASYLHLLQIAKLLGLQIE